MTAPHFSAPASAITGGPVDALPAAFRARADDLDRFNPGAAAAYRDAADRLARTLSLGDT